MTAQYPRYLASCTFLFTELPLLQRPEAAKASGFDAVEFWWPFDGPVPDDRDLGRFVTAILDADVELACLNLFAGDVGGPDCGILSIPGRSAQFRDNVSVALWIAEQTGVKMFNALYGIRLDGAEAGDQDMTALDNLIFAAKEVDRIGGQILLEPVSGPKPYPLRTSGDVIAVVDRVRAAGVENVNLLLDVFHTTTNGDDVIRAIDNYRNFIAHVQIADIPGRGEPGSGELEFDRIIDELGRVDYEGWIALEYRPTTSTETSLEWLPRDGRGRAGVPG